MKKALRNANAYQNLYYDVEEDGETINAEVDGLLQLDSALFIVEVKSGSMTLPARRGAPLRMVEDLKQLVGTAHGQAIRVKKYFNDVAKPSFRLEDGTRIEISKERIKKVFMVTVTLESLDAFVTALYQLEDLGLFSRGDLPWAVTLLDLEVIADLSEDSCQFVHYLTRRNRLNEIKRVTAHDELDWFGHYLKEGLYFENLFADDKPGELRLLSYTTEFDDYYFYKFGYRTTPVPIPRQPMPDTMRAILRELDSGHPSGYLEVASALLDMDSPTRERFCREIEGRRRHALADDSFHDCSLYFDNPNWGFTFMFGTNMNQSALRMKKYQTKSDRWYGIGCIADSDGWTHMGVVLEEPWKHDADMEKLVAESLPVWEKPS